MTRIPLAISDSGTNSPSLTDPSTLPTSPPPEAWVSVAFAVLFLILGIYHGFLLVKHRAHFSWTIVFVTLLECVSLIEFAYSTAFPISIGWSAAGSWIHWLAPTVITVAVIQVFGRAAWHALITNPGPATPLYGFIRWNTLIFSTISLFAWVLLCTGSMVAVAASPDGVRTDENAGTVDAGYRLLKTGLVFQLVILSAFALIVWRFKHVSRDWHVRWTEKGKASWTWQGLLKPILAGIALLSIRQVYHIIRFFLNYSHLEWLSLVLDAGPIFATAVVLAVYHPGMCLPAELTRLRLQRDNINLRGTVVDSSKAGSAHEAKSTTESHSTASPSSQSSV